METIDLQINFIAILLSGLLAFLLGTVWYHPKAMGKQWAEARGVSLDTIKPSVFPFVASFFLWTLSACFYAFLASFLSIENVPDLQLAAAGYFALSCMLWVAFAMPPALMGALYTSSSFEATAIDASYHLGGYYVFAVVHIAFLYF